MKRAERFFSERMMKVNLTPDLVSKEQLIGKIQKDMV